MTRFFDWDKIVVKGNPHGVKKTTCPVCSESRRDKKDPCLYVNYNDGVAKCFNCEALSFKDSVKPETQRKTYKLPEQTWENHTSLSDGLVKWCSDTRHIPQRTLIEAKITEEQFYMPQRKKQVNCMVFNYFEGDTIVNKKYRDAKKNFTQSGGGKPILYNINSAIGAEELYIVEGEMDVLAMMSQRIKNVVSIPNGANDNDDQWINSEKYLSSVKHFILATDNDEKGIGVREKISHRLGKYRCSYIEWTDKDANGSLISGNFDSDISKKIRFPVSGTFNIEDLYSGVIDLYENGLPKTIYPKHRCFEGLSKVFSVMKGHLVTVVGVPSSGKSNFTEWYVLNLIHDHGMKASFFSPEHSPMELHQTTFMEKAIGKSFWKSHDGTERMSKDDIDRYREWAKEKLYVTTPERGQVPTWDWLFSKFQEQLFSFGVNIFVIDAFNKLTLPSGNKIDAIGEVLTKLTSFAQTNDVIVFLVVHPTKMRKNENTGKYETPTLYDASGSADFRNQTHDGFSISRNYGNIESGEEDFTEFVNAKTKFKFQGQMGEMVKFKYHIPTGRYYEMGCNPPTFDMTLPLSEQTLGDEPLPQTPIRSSMKPNTSFDVESEIDRLYDDKDDEHPF